MISLFRSLSRDEDGIIAVEFSLVSPIILFATLFSVNLGVKVNEHQKIASSINAGMNYLSDYTLMHNEDALRPSYNSQSGTISDTALLSNVKSVIKAAYGDGLNPESITVDTYCGCPDYSVLDDLGGSVGDEDFGTADESVSNDEPAILGDNDREFYTRTDVSLSRQGELCAFQCPNGNGRARIVTEIQVAHVKVDLFGKQTIVVESLKSRIR